MIGASSAASAHANYLRSDPAPNAHLAAPPARVLVGFSENVQVASSGLTLLDQSGRQLATGNTTTADPAELTMPFVPSGSATATVGGAVYTVAWHTVSAADGDPASGYFAFEVGAVPAVVAPGMTQSKTQNGVTVTLGVSPDVAGKNGYLAAVKQGDAPLANVDRVRLRVTPLDRDIGQSEIVLASSGGGAYGGSGYELPFAGHYRVQVQIRRSDTIDDLAFDFDVTAAAATASPSPSVAASTPVAVVGPPTLAPAPATEPVVPTSTVLLGGVLVVLAAAAAIALARRRT